MNEEKLKHVGGGYYEYNGEPVTDEEGEEIQGRNKVIKRIKELEGDGKTLTKKQLREKIKNTAPEDTPEEVGIEVEDGLTVAVKLDQWGSKILLRCTGCNMATPNKKRFIDHLSEHVVTVRNSDGERIKQLNF